MYINGIILKNFSNSSIIDTICYIVFNVLFQKSKKYFYKLRINMDISMKPKIYVSILPQKTCISQDFKLTKIDDIPCAYCGKPMKTQKFLEKVFDRESIDEPNMLNNAIEMGQLLTPFKQQVLNFLIQIKFLNNLTTDNQILREARLLSRQYIREDILTRYNQIVDIIKSSNKKRLKTYMDFNEERIKENLIKKARYEKLIKFVREKESLNISPFIKKQKLSKINDIIFDIEKEQYTEDYILRKTAYKTPKEFFVNLFEKTISSLDHITPKSQGGSDTRDNFLAVCRNCNEEKSNKPLILFMDLKPEVEANIKKQLYFLKTKIPVLIERKKLSKEYLNYTDIVSKTLTEITNRKLDLNG